MDGWKRATLGEVTDLNWGDTKTTKAAYVSEGYTAFSASGPDGFLPYHDYDRTGVVLSAIGSECGKTWLARGKWSCIKNTIRYFSKSKDVDTEFLYWATRSSDFWPKRGSGQPFISQGDARACTVHYPPLPEQRAIAATLRALDDKIELNRKMNATLEAMARALFRDWFVDFGPTRAKMEARAPYLSPDLWSLFPDRLDAEGKPEGWEEKQILEVVTLKSGKPWSKSMRDDSGVALAFGANGPIGRSTEWMGDSEVVFLGKIGSCGAINEHYGKFWATNNTYFLEKSSARHFHFSRQVIQGIDWKQFIGGSSNPYMPTGNFDHLTVLVADALLMDAYEDLVCNLRPLVHLLNEESRTLAQTRNLLLPRLMSGELRVADINSEDAEQA